MKGIKHILASLVFGLGSITSQSASHAEDKWGVATGSDNGKPLIYRYIVAPPEGISIATYPNLFAVTWEYDGSARNGMPEEKINERMVQLESLLEENLEKTRNAFLTVSVTGNGRKEWQWYSRDVNESMKLLNEALSGHAPFPIKISHQSDPEWSAYSGILKAARRAQ